MLIVTVLFMLCLSALFINLFRDIIIAKHPFFKFFLVEGQVTGFDDTSVRNERYFLTIVSYTKYDMTYKTFVHSSRQDEMNDKILVLTNLDMSVRKNIYWAKDLNYEVLVYDLLGILIFGGMIIYHIHSMRWIYVGIGCLVILILLFIFPLLYCTTYKRIKNKLGYLYQYK